ncbi:MAG: hypothetical protein H0X24_12110 [Ktedonobacterales bacterium]|nr:hypothetical protein [Ktedonobacterales bacterium]
MEWLEKKSQPYIVIATTIAAVIRGFYLFTDKLVNLTQLPWLNLPLSVVTGIIMSIVSELTISIAGRRHKLYKQQLYIAKMSAANATKQTKEIWQVEVERLKDQVAANILAMRVSMVMSLVAASSYLIDSTGAQGLISFLVASSLAGYVLYMMYYHGVQTDEIKEDGSQETADNILDTLNAIRIEEVQRLRTELQNMATLSVPARLALIASGLPITSQKAVMPTVRLLLKQEEPEEERTDISGWYTMKEIALHMGEDLIHGNADNITRKYRRRCADNAHKFPESIRLDPMRGWLIEPEFAKEFFDLPDSDVVVGNGTIVDANPPNIS